MDDDIIRVITALERRFRALEEEVYTLRKQLHDERERSMMTRNAYEQKLKTLIFDYEAKIALILGEKYAATKDADPGTESTG